MRSGPREIVGGGLIVERVDVRGQPDPARAREVASTDAQGDGGREDAPDEQKPFGMLPEDLLGGLYCGDASVGVLLCLDFLLNVWSEGGD